MKTILLICSVLLLLSCSESKTSLFNGKDLSGWDTYVGPAYDTARKKFDTIPGPGLNNDPDKIFSVATVDGGPALKISGTRFGGISTTAEYSNYHLTVEFKWGQAKYAPKLNDNRDSGLLYHGVGTHGADGGFWLKSQEFQVQEGDCGDYWGVAGGAFDIPVVKVDGKFIYDATGDMTTFVEGGPNDRHAVKSPDAENPSGEWNTLELYCLGDSAVHVVNGVVVMRLYNSNLKKGKIQFQSEGAEVYYRNLQLQQINSIPELQ